jgi:hypothetical protein
MASLSWHSLHYTVYLSLPTLPSFRSHPSLCLSNCLRHLNPCIATHLSAYLPISCSRPNLRLSDYLFQPPLSLLIYLFSAQPHICLCLANYLTRNMLLASLSLVNFRKFFFIDNKLSLVQSNVLSAKSFFKIISRFQFVSFSLLIQLMYK